MNKIIKFIVILTPVMLAGCSNEPKESAAYAAGGLYAEVALIEECSIRFPELDLDADGAKEALRRSIEKTDAYFLSLGEPKWIGYAKDDARTRVRQEGQRGTFTRDYCFSKVNDTISNGPPERIRQRLEKF